MAHNQRIRQLLNRISISVKEYDAVQRSATNTLGKKYHALPKELIETFGHDPAAVTGSTRRLRGWRAVEDIHQRLIRQRQVLAAFISSESHRSSDFGSILDSEVTSLTQNLSILEEQKKGVATRAEEVEKALENVQKTFKGVKTAYDMTVPLTSAIYPEVNTIFAKCFLC
jgi:chromosome segregation ATPase